MPHLSVSWAMSAPNWTGERGIGAVAASASRALIVAFAIAYERKHRAKYRGLVEK